MPRNNPARTSAPEDSQAQNAPQAASPNLQSILNFVVPTEFVNLPSRGLFYKDTHVLHNKESIEIKHISAREIDILTSQSLLKKGVALDRMIESIIVDKSINVSDMLNVDKNAIIVAARVTSFGSDYGAKMECQNCGASYEADFDLEESERYDFDEDELEMSEKGTFFMTLPQTEVRVECRVLSSKDEKMLEERRAKKERLNLPESFVSDQYKSLIVSLNGVTERGLVDEFVDVMPAADLHFLTRECERLMPTLTYVGETTCSHCGTDNEVEIPFTTSFFWPE
jgi:hypothetical protein